MTTWKIMATLAGILFIVFCTLCVIIADSQKLVRLADKKAESRTIQVRRRVNNGTRIDDHQQQLWDYFSQQLEESPSSALHSPDPIDSFREKRFYPMHINIGCVKGFRCCEDAKCKPFCTLCYGGYGAPTTTTPKCKDVNKNGICDDEDEKKREEEDYDEKDEEKAAPNNDDDYDEKDEEKADPNDDYDEKDGEKAQPGGKEDDDYDEKDEEKAAPNAGKNDTIAMKNDTNPDDSQRYELTYHIYEEYVPEGPTKRSEVPPIIVQTIPQYSVSNFYGLNKQDFSHLDQHHFHIPQNHALAPPVYVGHSQHHHHHEDLPPRLYYGDILSPKPSYDEHHYPIPPPTTHIINDHNHQIGPQKQQPPLLPSYEDDRPTPHAPHYETRPLLKYHLIHHSFPAKKGSHNQPPHYDHHKDNDDYVPTLAFYPGPPYFHSQQEPQNSKIAEGEQLPQKTKKKKSLLTGLMKRIFG